MDEDGFALDPQRAKELSEFKERLSTLRISSVLALVLHIFITGCLFIMAYSRGGLIIADGSQAGGSTTGEYLYLSESIAVFSFVALDTCVFVAVETWKAFSGTQVDDLPTWKWHNTGFLQSVGNFVAIMFTLCPGVVIFVIHSKGTDIMTLMDKLDDDVSQLIWFHFFVCFFSGILDIMSVYSTTVALRSFQSHAEQEMKEEDEETDNELVDEEEEDDFDEEDERRPVTKFDRLLAGLTTFAHFLVLLDIILINASLGELNSGAVMTAIFMGILTLYWLFLAHRNRSLEDVTESQLLSYRLLTIAHLLVLIVIAWVDLLSVIVFNADFGTSGMVETIFDLDQWRTAITCLVLLSALLVGVVYGVILYVHSRSMWSLDEIASLRLASDEEKRLKENAYQN